MSGYVSLHNHSAYSLLDSIARIDEMVAKAKELGYGALAVTDHGHLHAMVKFQDACQKAGIKQIIGMEAYAVPDVSVKSKDGPKNAHLLLLARNDEGLKNLITLSSRGFLEGFYYRPRIDHQMAKEHGKGIIATTACLASEVCRFLMAGDYDEAKKVASHYASCFDEFFVELMAADYEEQIECNKRLISLARDLNLPLIVTTDAHYVNKEDARVHDIALQIRTTDDGDEDRRGLEFPSEDFYLKSEEEVRQSLLSMGIDKAIVDEAVSNTGYIAKSCDAVIETGVWKLPKAPLPEGFDSSEQALRALCLGGLLQHANERGIDFERYVKQLDYELSVMEEAGITDYMMIVSDLCRWAKSQGIHMGPARGSSGGSVVAMASQITDIDPVEHNLMFERFFVPGRRDMPDIDLDFSPQQRKQVIEYLANKYGKEHVAYIRTFNHLGARSVIRDVARVLPVTPPGESEPRLLSYVEADAIANAIPEMITDDVTDERIEITIDAALEESAVLREFEQMYPEVFRIARRLEGLPRHTSTHAGGTVITPIPVHEIVPVMRAGDDGIPFTQLDKYDLEAMGVLKIDNLAVEEIGIIARTISHVPELQEKLLKETGSINWHSLSLDDDKVYELIAQGHVLGLFQVGTNAGRKCVRDVGPTAFKHLVDVLALVRPGAQKSGQADAYIRCHRGLSDVEYPHDALVGLLEHTYGQMLYQEQIMGITRVLAGFSHMQADSVRKATARKQQKLMDELEGDFLQGCQKVGLVDPMQAAQIWEQIKRFGDYSFNLSHAAAYAIVTYWTAWLKLYYPVEFLASAMTSKAGISGSARKRIMTEYVQECRRLGIRLLPPDINSPSGDFFPEGGLIRWGLSAITGVGASRVDAIISRGPFESLDDFIAKVPRKDCNKIAASALILSGAFDGVCRLEDMEGRLKLLKYYFALQKEELPFEVKVGRNAIAIPRRVTKNTMARMEESFLGCYVTCHPFGPVEQWMDAELGEQVEDLVGQIASVRRYKVRRGRSAGKDMAIVHIDTASGRIRALFWPSQLSRYEGRLKQNAVLSFSGKKDEEDTLIVEAVRVAKIDVEGKGA